MQGFLKVEILQSQNFSYLMMRITLMLFEAQQKKVSEKADPKEKRKIGKEVKI